MFNYLKVGAWLTVVGVVLAGLWALERHGYDRAKAEYLKEQLAAVERIKELEANLEKKVERVEYVYVERKKEATKEVAKFETAVDKFNDVVDSLPNCSASSLPNNPQTTNGIDEQTDILKQCVRQVGELDKTAREFANQIKGLQDYINVISTQ